jgi:integrase
MAQTKTGWITRQKRKKGDAWVWHCYRTRPGDGKRVENTFVIGALLQFPREADAWTEVERRAQTNSEGKPGSRLTVSHLTKSYQNVELPTKAFSTRELHDSIIKNYILPRWGKQYADEVRVLELRKWFISLAEDGLVNVTIQKIKGVMCRIYNFDRQNELTPLSLNPVAVVSLRGIGAKGESIPIVVSPEIAWKIAMEMTLMHRTLVLVAAATALRISELLGLRWSDIDGDAEVIHLNRTWVLGQTGEGKSEASRKPITMGKRVAEFLRAWHRETPYSKVSDWVFPSLKLKGVKPLSGSQFVKDYLRPRFIEHGLITADYKGRAGLHAFRHSLSTVLITEEGVDPKTAQGILRHATSNITMDIYTHSQDAPKRAAQARYESRLVQ